MEKLLNYLREKSWTIGSVESFTGGLFACLLTEIPGVSSTYKGSIVAYSNELKVSLVGCDENLLNKHGSVSEWTAQTMAILGKEQLNCDVCVAFTGNAGPTSNDTSLVGQWYCAIAYPKGVKVFSMQSIGSRSTIRQEAVQFAINKCIECIQE